MCWFSSLLFHSSDIQCMLWNLITLFFFTITSHEEQQRKISHSLQGKKIVDLRNRSISVINVISISHKIWNIRFLFIAPWRRHGLLIFLYFHLQSLQLQMQTTCVKYFQCDFSAWNHAVFHDIAFLLGLTLVDLVRTATDNNWFLFRWYITIYIYICER